MADDVEFVRYAVAAMHVARLARDGESLAAIIAFHHRYRRRCGNTTLERPAKRQGAMQSERNFRLHVGELLLHQLVGGERPAELLAVERILPRPMPAVLCRTHGAPGNAITRLVEAAERSRQSARIREDVVFGDLDIVEHNLARHRSAQGNLALDLGRREALAGALDQETVNAFILELGPHHCDVGDRRIGDPHFRAIEHEAAIDPLGPGLHAAGIGAGIRLGQPEAADPFTCREFGQVSLALRFRAIGLDRMHDQGVLHAHCRAIARIDAFHFTRHQAIGDIAQGRTAIGFRIHHAEETDFT